MGEQRDRVYYYNGAPLKSQSNVVRVRDLWHRIMGHPLKEVMRIFAKDLGFAVYFSENSNVCHACFYVKQSRMQSHISENKAEELFEIVHSDVWGSCRVPSTCGAHYFLILVDDSSRRAWLYFEREK